MRNTTIIKLYNSISSSSFFILLELYRYTFFTLLLNKGER